MKVLVVGDIIRDHYVYGTMERLNPEGAAPLVRCTREETRLGGAANVWNNLISLGVDADIVEYNEHHQCVKSRVICDGHYVTRIDRDIKANGDDILRIVEAMDLSQYAYVILSDYNKGATDRSLDIIREANAAGCKVIVDPKRDMHHYAGAWLVKPNENEYGRFGFDKWKGNIITTRAGGSVRSKLYGMHISTEVKRVDVADVTGAGDCFLAAFVYGLTKQYDHKKCLDIAAAAASISVSHPGTYVLEPSDVEQKIVFTNGCFDILHRGHIEYLEQSRALGSSLIVGLNSDESVRRLKGQSRPINNEDDRKMALESLRCVDRVIIFDEDTPYDLIKYVKPDIITKGGDYRPEDVVGNDLADVVILPFKQGYSTTSIVEKL